MASSQSPQELQELRSYALGQVADAKGNKAAARKAIELVLAAATKPDRLTLQYAALIFENLHDRKRAIGFIDKFVAATPKTTENVDILKAMAEKRRKIELEAEPNSR